MCFDSHVGAVVRSCNYYTCYALRHVRKHLTTETVQIIACSVILSRIDYCNSLLYGAPVAVVEMLHKAQNNVASHMSSLQMCQCQTTTLNSVRWLPVHQRIQYRIVVITHKALSTSIPAYIDELLQRQVTTRFLRSTDAPPLSVPWIHTETAKRAYCLAAPNVWNLLLNDICNASSLSSFHAKLKSHILQLHRPTRDDIPTAAFLH